MHGLGGDKEVIVIVDDSTEEHEGSHAGNHGEECFDFGWLPPHPCLDGLDRPLRWPLHFDSAAVVVVGVIVLLGGCLPSYTSNIIILIKIKKIK